MNENAVLFGHARSLVGVLTEPPDPTGDPKPPAILFLNDGLIPRVGPHRLYVKMARHLATLGVVVLRFDFSGIGDSDVRRDNRPFEESAVSETREAMDFLGSTRGIEHFILIGICSGGRRAFQTACADHRVVGAAIINTPRFSTNENEVLRASISNRHQARGYWQRAVSNPHSWMRVLAGKTDYGRLVSVLGFQLRALCTRKRIAPSIADQHVVAEMRALLERDVRLLLAYAEGQVGLEYLHVICGDEMQQWRLGGKLSMETINGAEETFAPIASQEALLKTVSSWVYPIVRC